MYKLQITHPQCVSKYSKFDKGIELLDEEYPTYGQAWDAMSSYIQSKNDNWSYKFCRNTETVDYSILVHEDGDEEFNTDDNIINAGDYNIEIVEL